MFEWLPSLSWNKRPTTTGLATPTFPSVAGETVNFRTASTVSSYYAAIRNVSEDIGKLPSPIIRVDKDGNKTQAKDHPSYRLLMSQANSMMSAFTFKELLNSWAQGWGNGFAEIEFDARMNPVALWPIHPARVQPWISENIELYYYVYPDFDIRGPDVTRKGEPIVLADWQMFHLKGPTEYGIWGKSVLQTMAESIGISIAAQKFGAAFYGNGAHAGGFLKHPETISAEAGNRLKDQIQKTHKGAGKSGSIMMLEEGMDFQSNTVSPRDAQALELRQFEVTEIARWFRIQPHKLQDLSRATYSNIEQQNLDYVTDTLLSWTTRWEAEAHLKILMSDNSLSISFDFNFLLKGDRAARASYYSTMRFMGAMNVNEIRKGEDMNSIGPLGDEYVQQSAMVPLGQAPTKGNASAFAAIIKNAAYKVTTKESKACDAENKKARDHAEWAESFWPDQICFCLNSFLPVIEAMDGLKILTGTETLKVFSETIDKIYAGKETTPTDPIVIIEAFNASKR
jgi:HK97 family phage portal protein